MSIKGNIKRRAFLEGERVRVTRNIDLSPYAIVQEGELGTVIYVGAEETDIKMDTVHEGLRHWHNCIWIIPDGETEDVRTALELLPKQRESRWTQPQSDCSAY